MENSADFIKTFYIFFYCQMSSQWSIQSKGKHAIHYCATELLNSSRSDLWSAACRGKETRVHGAPSPAACALQSLHLKHAALQSEIIDAQAFFHKKRLLTSGHSTSGSLKNFCG